MADSRFSSFKLPPPVCVSPSAAKSINKSSEVPEAPIGIFKATAPLKLCNKNVNKSATFGLLLAAVNSTVIARLMLLLNKVLDDIYWRGKVESGQLKELIGHTPIQVFVGSLLGFIIATFLYYNM